MICPKCGARLAQGSSICPICGTKIRPSKQVKTKNEYEEPLDGYGYNSEDYEDDPYEDDYEDDGYDDYDDDYDYEDDDYEPAKPKTNRILVVVIITVLALIAAMVIMIILLFSNGKNDKKIPNTVDKIEVETQTKEEIQTEKETETEVVEIQGTKVTSGKNVYELENGELKLVEYNDQGQVVRIPAEIGGYPVTSIGSYAFKNNTGVQYLKLPTSMKELDDHALSDIELLKEIVVPESVESIGNLVFGKVQKAICISGSYAWSYMKYMADEVVEGTSLSLDENNVVTTTSAAPYIPPVQTTAAVQQPVAAPTTAAPQTTTAAPQTQESAAQQPSETTSETAQESQPSDTTSDTTGETTPSESPAETTGETTEADTQPSESPSETETQPESQPTERNAENILAKIAADTGGTVVGNSYMFYDFNGNGVAEAFAMVDIGGRKEIWYNAEDSSSNIVEIFPITDIASCSVNVIANGSAQFVLSVTTSAGESYSCIYGSDGGSGYVVADLLPGVLVSDGVSLKLNNGTSGTAYLVAQGGTYYEYTAQEISKSQFDAMPGAESIWAQVSALIGESPADLRFWNRSSAVGNLIQIAFTDAVGTPGYINVSWTQDGMQFEGGAFNVQGGVVKASYTGLAQIGPQEIPQIATEPSISATEITFTEGTAVILSSEGTNYTADLDGDGSADYFQYRTTVAEDGITSYLIVTMNGTDYTVGSGSNAVYKVEVCDLNTSDDKLNFVVVGTGADNSITSFQVFNGTDLSTPIMKNGYFSVLNGYGTVSRLYNTSHVLTPSSASGSFDEDGGFSIAVTSPITIDSLGRYVCKIPYELENGVVSEDALSETTGNYEYELVDLTAQEQFNYILAADTDLLTSAAADAPAAAQLPAGTWVFPRKLVQPSAQPGAFYLYIEDASGNAGYLPLGAEQTLFNEVPQ